MWAVPNFVPDVSEKEAPVPRKPLKINRIDGAGRGNRTPMELLPTDFESAASASSAIPAFYQQLTGHRAASDATLRGRWLTMAKVSLARQPARRKVHAAFPEQ